MDRTYLHHLVDELPKERENEAYHLLQDLCDVKEYMSETAPFDDESLTPEDIKALDEAQEEVRTGRFITQDDLERKFGV